MQINGIKTFKIDTVDSSGTDYDPTVTAVSDGLDDVFSDLSGTETTPSTPLDEYVINDPNAASPSGAPADSLANYPPTLEEIVAGDERVMRYLDVVKGRYEKAKSDLQGLLDNYMAALPYVTVEEAADLQRRIDYIRLAIPRCDEQIEKVKNLMDSNAKVYDQELACGKDLNGDGYIGRPGAPGTVGVLYDEDGKIHYIDPLTGKAIAAPIADPDYEPQLTNDMFDMIDAETALGESASDPSELADVYLQLKDLTEGADYGNEFNTPIAFYPAEYIWVKRDADTGGPKEDFDAEVAKYEFNNKLWTIEPGRGLIQKIPENKSDYVQVRVAEAVITSMESGYTDTDGNPLYDTYIELKDADGYQLASMRITGRLVDSRIPAAADTTSGYYLSASSVGFTVDGKFRANPIKIDASSYKSTGRHITADLESTLNISCPSDDDTERCQDAYNNNLAAFEGSDFTTVYHEVTGTGVTGGAGAEPEQQRKEISHPDFDDGTGNSLGNAAPYGGYQDRYVAFSDRPGETDTLRLFQTGVFFTGTRGILYGSDYANDLFVIPGANELNDYAKEHRLPDSESIKDGDAFYSTVVYGGAGNNFLRAGKDGKYQGDLFAEGIGFAYVDADHRSHVEIKVIDEAQDPNLSNTFQPGEQRKDSMRDPLNFVWVDGAGESVLYDYGEDGVSNNEAYYQTLHNDYYRLDGNIRVSKPGDEDIVGSETLSNVTNLVGDDQGTIYGEREQAILDDMAGIGEDELEFDPGTQWMDEYGYAAEQDAEMDSFFEATFGDLNEFAVELSNPTNTAG